jgi:hypothetical protein
MKVVDGLLLECLNNMGIVDWLLCQRVNNNEVVDGLLLECLNNMGVVDWLLSQRVNSNERSKLIAS